MESVSTPKMHFLTEMRKRKRPPNHALLVSGVCAIAKNTKAALVTAHILAHTVLKAWSGPQPSHPSE